MTKITEIEVFEQLIEALVNCDVGESLREQVYEHLIEAFDEDPDLFENLKGLDHVFDMVWDNNNEDLED